MPPTGPLRALIPTAGAHDLLERALSAVSAWDPLVVDDSPHGLDLPGALRTPGGLGFAQAVNLGLERLCSEGVERVLLLNDDAHPLDDCVARLISAADSEPEARLVAPVLVGPQGVESAGLRYNPRSARLVQNRQVPDGPVEVDALSGACLLMDPTLRFDPAFSHAMEDVELSLRVRQEGGRCLLVPGARCWHEGGGTLPRDSAKAQEHALRGHLRLHDGQPLRQGLATVYAMGQVLREGAKPERLAALGRAWRKRD